MSYLKECYSSNSDNPMKNFMPFDDRNRGPACNDNFTNNTVSNAYTMPVTTCVQDTITFAKSLFPNTSKCRETGYMCISTEESKYNIDRLAYYPKDQYYQTISGKNDKK
jgi:hypothetical protein